jgi:hypothetical protein
MELILASFEVLNRHGREEIGKNYERREASFFRAEIRIQKFSETKQNFDRDFPCPVITGN